MTRKIKAIALAVSMLVQIAANAIVGDLTAFAASRTVTFDISKGSVNITGSTYSGYNSSGTNISGSSSGVSFVITGTTKTNTVTVSGTQNITLSDCSIDVSSTGSSSNPGDAAFRIVDDNTGNVNVILVGKNTLKSGYDRAGLEKNGDTSTGTLTISGTGKLNTTGGTHGAGIGGGDGGSGSNITISGGTVAATGDGISDVSGGAGIGGGNQGNGSNITIIGGTVIARSDNMGAGIGGGSYSNGSHITISNGIVEATARSNGAGIGGGWSGSGSDITISGGTVTATAYDGGAGIGNGNRGPNGSNILITGGVINATGGKNGAGIGAGGGGDVRPAAFGGFSNIRITGGTIKAYGGEWNDGFGSHGAAGIGGSLMGKCVSGISIEGGTVTAVGAANAAGIGGGDAGDCSDVTITGGSVKATAGSGCNNNIGSGAGSTVVTSITDGTSDIYLFTLANPNSADVMIDDVSYTPVNHTAADRSDKNLYVYLTAGPHTISCGNVTRTYVYSTSLSKWLVSPISSFSSTAVTKTYGDAAFSAGFTTDSDGTVSYSSSNTSVATVASNGTITIKGAGSTIITASTPKTSSYTEDSKTMTLTVNKKGSYLTGVTASGITYGQSLNSSILNHTDGISGTLTWSAPNTKPNAGAQNYEWIFTPTDTTNYAVVTGTTSVSVAKADPTITASPTQGITYGQKLSETGISGSATGVDGVNLTGTWAYQTPNAKPQVLDSGRTQYTIVFTPSDANYNSTTVTTTVQVSPATLTTADISVKTTSITYGQTLSASNITAACSKVSGTIAWSAPNTKPSVTDSGVKPYAARFTPSSSNYKALDLTATVVVNKASTNITVDIQNSLSASDITYGQTLGDSTILGDKPAPGYYTWANPDIAPTVANSTITEYDVIFIPSDETNYNRSSTKLKLKVNPATLVLTPEIKASITASQITYGDTLANSTLSGTTPIGVDGQNVVGQYVWVDNTIAPEVANSDRTKYDVVFKPTDSLNYTEVSGLQATVTVIKATPVITPEMEATISATAITYNQTLADSQLSGNTPIPGHYEWVNGTIAPSVANSGITEYDVRFIPDDTVNNNTVEGITCKLIVNKATPDVNSSVLATLSALDITYGESLADSSIAGDLPVNSKGDEVAGSYAWADSSIKPSVSDSELNPYTVIFTPADTDNYITATFTLTLKVNKADITIPENIEATITASDIVYEQSLGDSTLSGTMPDVNGTPITGHYEWADSSIQPSVAASGVTVYEVVFKPDDSINYNDVTGLYTTLIITKLIPSIEPDVIATLSASGITYGQTLGDSTISGNTPVDGSYRFVNGSTVPTVNGTNNFAVEFVPNDTDNYEVVSVGDIHVTVTPTTLTITGTGIASGTYGDALNQLTVSGLTVKFDDTEISGSWSLEGTEIPNIPDSNSYTATFTPDENADCFNTLTANVSLSITADLIISPTNSGDELIYGVDYTYENTTPRKLIILSSKPITIRNADPNVPTADTIKIAKDVSANLTLAGVNIDSTCAIEIEEDSIGDVTITLADGTNNILKSGTGHAGIEKNGNAEGIGKLIINGTGSLTVQGGENAAGIGGSNGKSAANIVIDNGNINAIGGANGAGIGGGANGNGTDITVNNGTVTATGGINGAGIGGGNGGNGEKIIINNGTVNATGGDNGAGIGGGANGNGSNITLNGGNITTTGGTNAAGIGGGNKGNGENIIINNGTVNATGGENAAGIGGGNGGDGSIITIKDGDVTANGGENGAGIGGGQNGHGKDITIDGGDVTATGGSNGAGIGGGANGNGTDITVNDGTVTAIGGTNGAGIGGGDAGNGENIVINNGTVITTGGENGAGIGGGQNGHGKDITLAGGNITATGGANASGIGGGSNGNLETLVITGGTIIATGGAGGAGIGGGANGTSADISITGGSISAEGGSYTEDGNTYTGADIGNGIGRVNGVPVNGIPAEIVNEDQITHLLTINVPTGSTIIVDGQTIVTGLPNIGLLLEEPGPHTVTINDVTVNYIWSDHNNKWMIIPEVIAPTAKTNLKYTGNAQELIIAGSTTGGTLEYSLAETEGYSTSIPTGTQANTYTVWYRVIGNDDYTDVAPASIQVTISRKSPSGSNGGSSGGSSSGGSGSGSSSATSNPLLNGKPATWSSIADEISKFNKGTSATISMNGETIIPSEVVKAINDTDSKITFKLDGVFSWLVDGADINSNEPIDLSINRISGVPTTGVEGIVGTQIKLNNTVAGIDLGINFKKEYDNQFANLYKQTSEGLEFVTCSKICNTGYVLLEDVKYAGNYVVMISQFSSKPGDINGDGFINAKDASAVLKHTVGIEAVRNAKMADVNHDGYINAKDASKILRVSVGLETM